MPKRSRGLLQRRHHAGAGCRSRSDGTHGLRRGDGAALRWQDHRLSTWRDWGACLRRCRGLSGRCGLHGFHRRASGQPRSTPQNSSESNTVHAPILRSVATAVRHINPSGSILLPLASNPPIAATQRCRAAKFKGRTRSFDEELDDDHWWCVCRCSGLDCDECKARGAGAGVGASIGNSMGRPSHPRLAADVIAMRERCG